MHKAKTNIFLDLWKEKMIELYWFLISCEREEREKKKNRENAKREKILFCEKPLDNTKEMINIYYRHKNRLTIKYIYKLKVRYSSAWTVFGCFEWKILLIGVWKCCETLRDSLCLFPMENTLSGVWKCICAAFLHLKHENGIHKVLSRCPWFWETYFWFNYKT